MTESYLLALSQKTLVIVLELSGPILVFSLIVGVLVSILQAATQIQDITLSFVPKILSVMAAFVIFGPWMLRMMVDFTQKIIVELPRLVR
jgi:flagellar biosynthesis protein FliQ